MMRPPPETAQSILTIQQFTDALFHPVAHAGAQKGMWLPFRSAVLVVTPDGCAWCRHAQIGDNWKRRC